MFYFQFAISWHEDSQLLYQHGIVVAEGVAEATTKVCKYYGDDSIINICVRELSTDDSDGVLCISNYDNENLNEDILKEFSWGARMCQFFKEEHR